MNHDYDFWAAMLIGLLSAGHCFGMCGGIVGTFSSNLPLHYRVSARHRLQYVISYNIGRITSYVIAGALIGYSTSYLSIKSLVIVDLLQFISGVMLIIIGLYITKLLDVVKYTECIGKLFWPFISPLAKHFIPFKSPLSALPFGFVWGWLPCGLVYSTLTWSAAAGSSVNGALIMLGFGLGTLPAMLSMSFFSEILIRLINNVYVRITSAIVIILYGIMLTKSAIIALIV